MCLTKQEQRYVESSLDTMLSLDEGQDVNALETQQLETLARFGIVYRHQTSRLYKFTTAGGALFESHRLRRKAERRESELQKKLKGVTR